MSLTRQANTKSLRMSVRGQACGNHARRLATGTNLRQQQNQAPTLQPLHCQVSDMCVSQWMAGSDVPAVPKIQRHHDAHPPSMSAGAHCRETTWQFQELTIRAAPPISQPQGTGQWQLVLPMAGLSDKYHVKEHAAQPQPSPAAHLVEQKSQ